MKTVFNAGSLVISRAVRQKLLQEQADLTSRRAACLIVVDVLYDVKGEAVMYECQNKYGILGIFDVEDIEAY